MTVVTTTAIVDNLLATLANSRQTVDQINAACTAKGLSPAFQGSDSSIGIAMNPDYRLEGFGAIVERPFPPKFALAFWVHYKPESSQHIPLGRFTMPMSFLDLLKFRASR
ncbi:hypothetical protein [Leptolyngbya sp. NIES-2104]|uniref:hypothetical protein n=1 Tax=Leptolyngbya sp. NIES-2104 TaxID=1552121 RepID=UPI0006EC4C4E|nr:hypothetical protein [Leptolyngbya sp. NIES-2104]GAP94298.1 hypothetical protein NIES2104_08090 [Leptolyngbya sp. NIES-2104]